MLTAHTEIMARLRKSLDPHIGSILVVGGPGHGDHCRELAIAAAYPEGRNVVALMQFNGSLVEWDLGEAAVKAGTVDAFVVSQLPSRGVLLSDPWLREHFTIIDAIPFAPTIYHQTGRHHPAEEEMLRPFLRYYSDHPWSLWRIADEGMTWWEIASACLGMTVTPDAIPVPLECSAPPTPEQYSTCGPVDDIDLLVNTSGSSNWEKADLHGISRYVLVQNAAGGGAKSKIAPPELFDGIVARLALDGVRCVQVGLETEPRIKDAIDRRGLRLPLTCRLLKGAIAHIACEGFMQYPGFGLKLPGVCFFGPTPWQLFWHNRNLNVIRGGSGLCPNNSCFWLTNKWGIGCMAFDGGYCAKMPQPKDCLDDISKFVLSCEEVKEHAQKPATEAVV